jgi:uncharacterized integral membrane protein
MFLVLIFLSYLGIMFVEANRTEVVIRFLNYESAPWALGFIVLTSTLIGMVIAGCLCSVELLFLYVQNRRLRRKLLTLKPPTPQVTSSDLHPSPGRT